MYAKIFAQIFDSSIADNWQRRHVFEDLLKLCDRNGVLDMTAEAISARTRVPLAIVQDAIVWLSRPDPRSRTKDCEGRRIVPLDPTRGWGWIIVNYRKYRELKSEFDRTAYMRDYMRKVRHPEENEPDLLNGSLTQSNKVLLSPSVSASESVKEGRGSGEGSVLDQRYDQERGYHRDTRTALTALNKAIDAHYREVDANLSIISARLKEPGVTIEGVIAMITRMVREWNGSEMERYLRPETLFRKSKFDSYYSGVGYDRKGRKGCKPADDAEF